MKKIVSLLLCGAHLSLAMDSDSQETEIAQMVKELTQEAQTKFQRMASLVQHAPFRRQVSKDDFAILKRLARPQNGRLLERLLEKKIVDANTTCEDNGKQFSLLGEAIDYFAREKECDKSWHDSRPIQLLLKNKADSNQECHFIKTNRKKRTSCLVRAVESGSMPVVGHLLSSGANPNKIDESGELPLNLSMKSYLVSQQLEFFNMARELVRAGAKPISKMNEFDFKLIKQLVYPQYINTLRLILQEKFLDARLSCDQQIGSISLMDEAIRVITHTNGQSAISSNDTNHDDINVVQLMINHGAQLKEEYLSVAACAGAKKLVTLLLKHQITSNCARFALQNLSMPTMYYIYYGGSQYYDIITMLLAAGTDPYFASFKDTQTPVGFAQAHLDFVNNSEQHEQAKFVNSKKRAEIVLGLFARCERK